VRADERAPVSRRRSGDPLAEVPIMLPPATGAGEDPDTIAAAVASILDAPVPEMPRALAEIARLRSATRRVLEGNISSPETQQLLRPLARLAARSELPEWALDAMVTEIRASESLDIPPLTIERAAHRLRRLGYGDCPTCARSVVDEITTTRWSRERRRYAEELALRQRDPLGGVAP
jgi:hypothetical protein